MDCCDVNKQVKHPERRNITEAKQPGALNARFLSKCF